MESHKDGAAEGYQLTAAGLGSMVKDNQVNFVKSYGGGDALAARLGCDANTGLASTHDFEEAKKKFGRNYIEPEPLDPYWKLIWEGLQDTTLLMLIASAVVSLILGLALRDESPPETPSLNVTGNVTGTEAGGEAHAEWIEGLAILFTVLVVLNVQAGTDYSKSRQFAKQQAELESNKLVTVIRSGKDEKIHPRELVVGDLMRVQVGDILAADACLLQGSDVAMDESALTGESTVISKVTASECLARGEKASEGEDSSHSSGPMPFMLSGTFVLNGQGKALVCAVGTNSLQGKILALATSSNVEVVSKEEGKEQEEAIPRTPVQKIKDSVQSFFTFGDIPSGGTLVEKLDHLAMDIGKAGLLVALLVFFVMLVMHFTDEAHAGEDGATKVKIVLEYFITAVTILVVAIPEGLPLAVTLSLAISMSRMIKDNNQVKHMDSCETMGSATTICSDKTGTLTENRMTVMRVFLGNKVYKQEAGSEKPVGAVLNSECSNAEIKHLLAQAIALNSSSQSSVKVSADGSWTYEGNATECALLKLCAGLGIPADSIRSDPRYADPRKKLDWGVFSIPFSSSRKKMSWIVPLPAELGGGFRLFSKGAPSYIFDICSKVVGDDFGAVPFTSELKKEYTAKMEDFQNDAMRTIGIAYKDIPAIPEAGWDAVDPNTDPNMPKSFLVESELTLIGVVGIEDPLRPSVIGAIKKCNSAGVDVRMCTGDALATAIAISKQCGILRPRDLQSDGKPKPDFAMTGAEFDERVHFIDQTQPKIKRRCFDPATRDASEGLCFPFLTDDLGNKIINQTSFDSIWPKLRVLARCQPEDKLTLVRGLRNSKLFLNAEVCKSLREEHGIEIFPDYQVVAVTGDGTNDAPALRSADVGFAMGIVGTDIAKQACDIMLLDDNFASIVSAVKWGRNVYDSIAKFIQFQVTINLVAITISVIGAFAFQKSPLSAVQMLWVNMIMDSLASMALATEPPTEILLERQPYGKRRAIISRVMMFNIGGQGLYQMIIICSLLFRSTDWMPSNSDGTPVYPFMNGPDDKEDFTRWTLVFNSFVFMQLANQLNSRKLQTVERLKATWEEWNVFSGITQNKIYLVVVGIELVLQVLIVQFLGAPFRCTPNGLSGKQWALCLLFALGSLPVQFIINAVMVHTDKYFPPETIVPKDTQVFPSNAVVPITDDKPSPMVLNPLENAPADDDKKEGSDPVLGRGAQRPYREYTDSKTGTWKRERAMSITGRQLLGLPDQPALSGDAPGSARRSSTGSCGGGAHPLAVVAAPASNQVSPEPQNE